MLEHNICISGVQLTGPVQYCRNLNPVGDIPAHGGGWWDKITFKVPPKPDHSMIYDSLILFNNYFIFVIVSFKILPINM